MSIHEVRIALATSPAGLSVEEEVRLLKPALLYADRVTLCSPTVSMLAAVAGLTDFSQAQRLEFLSAVVPALVEAGQADAESAQAFDLWQQLRRKRHRSPQELIALRRAERELDAQWDEVVDVVERLLASAGVEQLTAAASGGLLEISDSLASDPAPTVTDAIGQALGLDKSDSLDDMLSRFMGSLQEFLRAPNTYPLFDDATGSLVSAGIKEGVLGVGPVNDWRGRQVSAAATFMESLPAFPGATLLEVLDIRAELARPLTRFRAAISKMTRDLPTTSYAPDFRDVLHQLYVEEVAPALQEIHEAVESNTNLKRLSRTFADSPSAAAGGVVAMMSVPFHNLPALIAGSVIAASPLIRAAFEQRAEQERTEQRQLFFLYRLDELLS